MFIHIIVLQDIPKERLHEPISPLVFNFNDDKVILVGDLVWATLPVAYENFVGPKFIWYSSVSHSH